jgi:hypothetical protein
MRFFKSTTWLSIWLAQGSSSLFALPALAVGLAGELADRYVTQREALPGWPSIESVILEHSALSTTSHATQEQDRCRLPTGVTAFMGSAAGVVKALAYTKRMASNAANSVEHGPEVVQ